MTFKGAVGPSGSLKVKRIPCKKAPLPWRIRNTLRWKHLFGMASHGVARLVSSRFPIMTITSSLSIKVRRADGTWVDYGIVGRRVVTTAGVNFLVDDWDDNSEDITTMTFHGIGTGAVAENIADTALGAEITIDLDPNNTRATGVKTQPSANILQTVGTLTVDGASAVTEHGIFDQAATGGGSLWDRTVFAVINLGVGDSIQCTYQCTITAGS